MSQRQQEELDVLTWPGWDWLVNWRRQARLELSKLLGCSDESCDEIVKLQPRAHVVLRAISQSSAFDAMQRY